MQRTRIITAMLAAACLALAGTATATSPAHAYLNEWYAKNQCQYDVQADANNRGIPHGSGFYDAHRWSGRDVSVRISMSNGAHYGATYDCRYVGDSNPWSLGVMNTSFAIAYILCGPVDFRYTACPTRF